MKIEVLKIPYRAPRANAICERFLGSVRRECLDHVLIFGERQLYRVVKEYVAYYNRARPHQGLGQRIPEGLRGEESAGRSGRIISFPVLGGFHHDYRRAARARICPQISADVIGSRHRDALVREEVPSR
jgi:putative transposase